MDKEILGKINWCCEQKKGIKLISPNNNLALEYFKNAEETLKIINQIKDSGSNMWLATQKYYVEYFAAYSILMKLGIKCEIHSCTISIIKLLEELKILNFSFSEDLKKDKQLRIDNQYYLKNIPIEIDSKKLANLILNCKDYIEKISKDDIDKIRGIIENGK